jgi:hypothetical protein
VSNKIQPTTAPITDLAACLCFKVYDASDDYAGGFLGGAGRFATAGVAGRAAAVAARGGGFGFETVLGGAVASGLASLLVLSDFGEAPLPGAARLLGAVASGLASALVLSGFGEVPVPSDARLLGEVRLGAVAPVVGLVLGVTVPGVACRAATTPFPLNSPGLAVAAIAGLP